MFNYLILKKVKSIIDLDSFYVKLDRNL